MADMATGCDKKVSVAVGVAVEEDDYRTVAKKEQLFFIGYRLARRFKNTACSFRCLAENMFQAPGCPQGFHGRGEKW